MLRYKNLNRSFSVSLESCASNPGARLSSEGVLIVIEEVALVAASSMLTKTASVGVTAVKPSAEHLEIFGQSKKSSRRTFGTTKTVQTICP
jgi:hypothetical protein